MPGMTKKQKETVHQAEQLLHNARNNPDMAAEMAFYGYDEDRWSEGKALIEAAKAAAHANNRNWLLVAFQAIFQLLDDAGRLLERSQQFLRRWCLCHAITNPRLFAQ